MLLDSEETISPMQAVFGVINGMVGSLVLLLPVLTLSSGYMSTLIAIIITGLSCAFSSWLYFQHIGEEPDIGHALRKHFRGSYIPKMIYDFSCWLFNVMVCIEYFQLIITQWEIVIPSTVTELFRLTNSVINGLIMLVLVLLLKYWEIGATIMVYGIISIAIYLCYLLGVIITQKQEIQSTYQAFGSRPIAIIGAMVQAFMVQPFLVPFLQKIKSKDKQSKSYSKYANLSYLIGGFVYIFISEVGSFGICQRLEKKDSLNYGILGYMNESWSVNFICIIYTIHLYSAYPQFLLVSKRTFFDNLERCGFSQTSRRSINFQEIVYIIVLVIASVIIAYFKIPIQILLMVSGGIFSSIIIFIVPPILHMYCMFFISKEFRLMEECESFRGSPRRVSEIEINQLGDLKALSNLIFSDSKPQTNQSFDTMKIPFLPTESKMVQNSFLLCECSHYKQSSTFKIFMTILLIVLMILGFLVITETIRQMVLA